MDDNGAGIPSIRPDQEASDFLRRAVEEKHRAIRAFFQGDRGAERPEGWGAGLEKRFPKMYRRGPR